MADWRLSPLAACALRACVREHQSSSWSRAISARFPIGEWKKRKFRRQTRTPSREEDNNNERRWRRVVNNTQRNAGTRAPPMMPIMLTRNCVSTHSVYGHGTGNTLATDGPCVQKHGHPYTADIYTRRYRYTTRYISLNQTGERIG